MKVRITQTELDDLVQFLARNEYWRKEFLAKLSCAMVQTGSHIDSLPTNKPPSLKLIGK
jgi:hypothetical protein